MSYKNFIITELENQYSPSKWSIRDSAENVLKNHVEFVTKVSQETKKKIPFQQDIEISKGPFHKIDIFGTHLPNDVPWFVYIHGGYWQELSRKLSSYPVQQLVTGGICTVIAGYDLCPNVSLSQIVCQIKQTAKYCLEKAYAKGSRSVMFGGHSAGAHLASLILQADFLNSLPENLLNIVKGFCLISGVYDLEPLVHTSNNEKLLLSEQEIETLSPLFADYRNFSHNIQLIIAVGEHDSPAFILQSKEFYKKVKPIFSNAQYVFVNGYDHFNIVEDLVKSDYVLTKLIIKSLNSN